MTENKLFSTKEILVGAGLFFALWIIVAITILASEDKIVLNAFEKLNEKSPYILKSREVASNGVLGNFYSCLRNYRSIYKMRTKDGEITHAKLVISENYYFELSIIKQEVYRFDIVYVEDGLANQKSSAFTTSKRSDSYAVNCELSLLGKM